MGCGEGECGGEGDDVGAADRATEERDQLYQGRSTSVIQEGAHNKALINIGTLQGKKHHNHHNTCVEGLLTLNKHRHTCI